MTARLSRTGAALFRTDLDGAIQVETDGTELLVKTMRGRERRFSLWHGGRAARAQAAGPAGPGAPAP